MIMVHVYLPGRTANQTNSNTSDHHHTSPIPTFPNRKVVFQLPTTIFHKATYSTWDAEKHKTENPTKPSNKNYPPEVFNI